jgi:hypothetical protein
MDDSKISDKIFKQFFEKIKEENLLEDEKVYNKFKELFDKGMPSDAEIKEALFQEEYL